MDTKEGKKGDGYGTMTKGACMQGQLVACLRREAKKKEIKKKVKVMQKCGGTLPSMQLLPKEHVE